MKQIIIASLFMVALISINNELPSIEKLTPKKVLLVSGNNVNLREDPNINSRVIKQLIIGEWVYFRDRKGKKETIGDLNGEWIKVLTRYTDKYDKDISGWVFDYYLADESMFIKMNSFYNCHYEGYSGDWFINIQFLKNGTFRTKRWDDKKGDYYFEEGLVFKYRKLIHVKSNNSKWGSFFYINEKNEICHPSAVDEEGNVVCKKCD
jgi:hypothetical protein